MSSTASTKSDAVGRRLLATIDRDRVRLEIDPARPPEPESLERRLRGYFARLPASLRGHSAAAERARTLARIGRAARDDGSWSPTVGPRRVAARDKQQAGSRCD